MPTLLRRIGSKLVFIASISAIGSLTRLSLGAYRSVPETRAVLTEIIKETVAVANAHGIELSEDVIAGTLMFIDMGAGDMKSSMQRDVEAEKPTELKSIIGAIVRLGIKHETPTPAMRFSYAMLKPVEVGV
jgi:2-dehydropantoate 2-reductase